MPGGGSGSNSPSHLAHDYKGVPSKKLLSRKQILENRQGMQRKATLKSIKRRADSQMLINRHVLTKVAEVALGVEKLYRGMNPRDFELQYKMKPAEALGLMYRFESLQLAESVRKDYRAKRITYDDLVSIIGEDLASADSLTIGSEFLVSRSALAPDQLIPVGRTVALRNIKNPGETLCFATLTAYDGVSNTFLAVGHHIPKEYQDALVYYSTGVFEADEDELQFWNTLHPSKENYVGKVKLISPSGIVIEAAKDYKGEYIPTERPKPGKAYLFNEMLDEGRCEINFTSEKNFRSKMMKSGMSGSPIIQDGCLVGALYGSTKDTGTCTWIEQMTSLIVSLKRPDVEDQVKNFAKKIADSACPRIPIDSHIKKVRNRG